MKKRWMLAGGAALLPMALAVSSAGVGIALAAGTYGSTAVASAAAPRTYTIGVDNTTPSGHLLMYTDFFPRAGTRVLQGDIVDFKWNTGNPDGLHTATLLKIVDSPTTWIPPIFPDPDDGSAQLQLTPGVDQPSNPSCGTAGTPCAFDGTAQLNSGAFDTAPGHDFYVAINALPGMTVNFKCLLHQAMVGSLSVVGSGASTVPSVDAAAAAQYTADTKEALAAEAAVTVPAATTNSDGSRTWKVQAGAQGRYEQVLEFFPGSFSITPGDSIKWTTKVNDIHTVTFPDGDASAADDWHTFVCEGGLLGTDTPAAAPPASPCPKPANFEEHILQSPAGGTTLRSPATVATSGLLWGTLPLSLLLPDHYTFKLSGAGNYTYQCKVHDHMTGAVWAVLPVAPPPGTVPQPAPAAGNLPNTTALAVPMVVSAVGFVSLALWNGIGVRSRRLTS
jgi:plastocyanin